jgi:predicted DNA-binding transcriptional regulator AlpA
MTPEHEPRRYVRAAGLTRMLDISRATVRQLVRDGVLPPPVVLSRKVHLWDVAEIDRIIEQRRRAA